MPLFSGFPIVSSDMAQLHIAHRDRTNTDSGLMNVCLSLHHSQRHCLLAWGMFLLHRTTALAHPAVNSDPTVRSMIDRGTKGTTPPRKNTSSPPPPWKKLQMLKIVLVCSPPECIQPNPNHKLIGYVDEDPLNVETITNNRDRSINRSTSSRFLSPTPTHPPSLDTHKFIMVEH